MNNLFYFVILFISISLAIVYNCIKEEYIGFSFKIDEFGNN